MPPSFMPSIGSHVLRNNLFVAPMAGVTDRPFRQLCKRMGAGYAVSEMVASNAQLWKSEKTMRRANHAGEVEPIAVQIAGADPQMLAEAARHNVANGAQIIDINMGCPAKKVCNVAAGSALLQNEALVARIVEAVVQAVGVGPDAVPVTLKIRTGWNRENKNALNIARIAENAGIAMLDRARPHARRPVQGRRGIRNHRGREGVGENSGGRERRHRHAGKSARRARRHRRRRHHDRPRGAGPPVALSRDRAFPFDRRAPACRRASTRSSR